MTDAKIHSIEPRYFVYVRNVGGRPAPQLWHGDQTKGTGRTQYGEVGTIASGSPLVYFRRLDGEDLTLGLLELEAKYPFVDGFSKI